MKNNSKPLAIGLFAVLISSFQASANAAAIVDIKFNAEGHFSHEVEMAVGKTIEICGPLKAGVAIDWSFKNSAPLNFNIHFHKGEEVSYPVQQKGASNLAQKFTPDTAQDYCWMWTNRSLQAVKLNVELSTAPMKIAAAAITNDSDMTAGEIRKVDKETKKITIKHAEIKNLEMPAMTMVFQVKEAALLDKVQAGDKVKFKAEKIGSAYVVTEFLTEK